MWKHILIACALCALTSCEKAILPEEEKSKNTEKTDTINTNNPSGGGTDEKTDYISVDSAIALPNNTYVKMKGYIVGSCSRSISNAIFTVPTDYSQSILMADRMTETSPDHLIAVKLTDRTNARRDLNLSDNKVNLHKRVIITAKRVSYLGIAGVEGVENDYGFVDE
jgi:hypothetical protein